MMNHMSSRSQLICVNEVEIIESTRDRSEWRTMIANVHTAYGTYRAVIVILSFLVPGLLYAAPSEGATLWE